MWLIRRCEVLSQVELTRKYQPTRHTSDSNLSIPTANCQLLAAAALVNSRRRSWPHSLCEVASLPLRYLATSV